MTLSTIFANDQGFISRMGLSLLHHLLGEADHYYLKIKVE